MSLDPRSRESLIRLARDAVAAVVRRKPLPVPSADCATDVPNGGLFVTLKNGARLRGCIGTFEPPPSLASGVVTMAVEAVNDPRFVQQPIMPSELDALSIEISVLTRPTRTNAPLSLRPGVDGVLIRRGAASGCFLPQVAAERGWNAEQTLTQCCTGKANLTPDAWQDPQTAVYFFTADVIRDDRDAARGHARRVAPSS